MTAPGTEEFWQHVLATLLELDSSSYYELLGLERGAGPDTIRARFERLDRELDPAAHRDEGDPENLRALELVHERLREAYGVLIDSASRARYDAGLDRGELRVHTSSPRPPTRRTSPVRRVRDAPSRVEIARALFNQGRRLVRSGDLRGAKVKWEMALHVMPSSSALRTSLSKLERAMIARADPRHAMSRPVEVACTSWTELRTLYSRDISRGGMFLASDAPLPVGTRVTLALTLPDGRRLSLAAEVAHVAGPDKSTGPGMGLRFVDLGPDTRDKLEQYVNARDASDAAIPMPIEREVSLPMRALIGDEHLTVATRRGGDALREGRYADAVQALSTVIDAGSTDPIVRAAFHLAAGHRDKAEGRAEAARGHFEAALRFDRQCEEAIRELRTTPPDDAPQRSIFDRLFSGAP